MSKISETGKPEKRPNRLFSEKSPYLLQHAYNPVDWYPWCSEAFEKARRENKPVFLSIGYSTCHWCHVMKRESFEDPEIASLMNQAFVAIKVDREERPDLDNLYMTVCQIISGNCGWPLTIIMTADKKPFFAGTYIPKETRSGLIGMLDLIPKIEEMWLTRPEDLQTSAEQITDSLIKASELSQGGTLSQETLALAYENFSHRFDEENGGFGGSPKFPTPHNHFFLLRYWKRTGEKRALLMVEKSLQRMRQGGIYDHVGFGFHRYSTDSKWLVPHFEKMLYDQALLAIAYLEAYQVAQKSEYAKTAREIFTYVLREMWSAEGGFYSAEDAESEGEEGRFYLWTMEEIGKILGEDKVLACKIFNIEDTGNFHDEASRRKSGRNILYLNRSLTELAYELKISENELLVIIGNIRQRLFATRDKRIHPHKDDKILTDWNGLMIAALAKGAQVLDEPKYLDAAKKSADFILMNMRNQDGRLLHRYREGQAGIPAFLDDYVFLIWGLIELYEGSFDAHYLQVALELNEILMEHFWDNENDGFYFTPDDADKVLLRNREFYDGAVPSGNSTSILNLIRLGRITANLKLEEKANRIINAFSSIIKKYPISFTQFMTSLDYILGPSFEVVIAGNSRAKDTRNMLKVLRKQFLPNKIILLNPTEEDSPLIFQIMESIKDYTDLEGKATAYICSNYVCRQPTTDINKMMELLEITL